MQKKYFHQFLRKNPNLPEHLCKEILNIYDQADILLPRYIKQGSDAKNRAIQHFSQSDSKMITLVILLNPLADPQFLAQKENSIYWIELWAIAQNPSTPKYIIKKLELDNNQLVRDAAKLNSM